MATKKAATAPTKKPAETAPEADEHEQIDVESELDNIEGWDETEKKEGAVDVKDGTYSVRVESCGINRAKSESKRLQVSFEFEIACDAGGDATYKGRKLFSHNGIEDDEQRGYLRGSLAKLGIDWPEKKDMAATLDGLVGTYCQVQVRTKKKKNSKTGEYEDRQNVYINKALDPSDIPEEVEASEVESEEPAEAPAPPPKKVGTKKPAKPTKVEEPVEEVEVEEPADEVEEAEGETEEAEAEEPVGVTTTFKALDAAQVTRIKNVGRKLDFDINDYPKRLDLLIDAAELVGLSGEFDNAEKLISAVEKAAAKKK